MRKPILDYQDEGAADLAEKFLSHPDKPTPGGELLDVEQFDFSLESLDALDRYLEAMRQRALDETERVRCVLRAGAYLGEVIRRHTPQPRQWHWVRFEDAVAVDPTIGAFGEDLGVFISLWDGGLFTFPVGKIEKYLENGPSDSTFLYGQTMVALP